MRILKLRAARGWLSVEQTAQRFLVTEETTASWVRRVDEGGERALVQIKEPVNKYPDLAVVVDHASRLVVGFALFTDRPTSAEVCAFLDRAIKASGRGPRHLVTDKGTQFFCDAFLGWCQRRSIRPRFGAVGEHGSIAIVERFIRSMKSECTRRILVPFRLDAMRHEIACHATWYNERRPHSRLGGRTPLEVYHGLSPANEAPRFEPRPKWPRRARCAAPVVPMNGRAGARLRLVVSRFENRPHLPVVELRRAG